MAGFFHGDLGTFGPSNQSVSARIGHRAAHHAAARLLRLHHRHRRQRHPRRRVRLVYRDRWPDQVIRIFSIACIATPSFWLSVLFILLFSSTLHLLPASGALPALTQDPGGWLARMAMPGIALAVPLTGQMTRIIRTSMVEELDKDYVRTARGFGIPYGTVVARNVLRNALITPVTVLGLKFGYMIGGAVVLEVIFALPGMGMAIVSGVTSNYVMLVQGVVLVVAITFIIVNVIVDMLYILIDPRIRTV